MQRPVSSLHRTWAGSNVDRGHKNCTSKNSVSSHSSKLRTDQQIEVAFAGSVLYVFNSSWTRYAADGYGSFFSLHSSSNQLYIPSLRSPRKCGHSNYAGTVESTELDLRLSSALPMHLDVAISALDRVDETRLVAHIWHGNWTCRLPGIFRFSDHVSISLLQSFAAVISTS